MSGKEVDIKYVDKTIDFLQKTIGPNRELPRQWINPISLFLQETVEESKLHLSSKGGALSFSFEPQDKINSEFLTEWAMPRAEQIRQEVFGRKEPPFPTWEEAVAWIQKEEKSYRPSKDWNAELTRLRRSMLAKVKGMQAQGMPFDVGLETSAHALAYPDPAGGPAPRVASASSPKLRSLSIASNSMAKATGCGEVQTAIFIMVGIPLFRPRLQLRISRRHTRGSGSWLARQWAELTINSTNISSADLHRVWGALRQAGAAKKALREIDTRVFVFVKERRPGITWEEVLRQWKVENPGKQPQTMRGLQKIYKKVADIKKEVL